MITKEDLKQYAIEMEQICSAYKLGQMTTVDFIRCANKFQDALSTKDNENNQDTNRP